MGKKEKTKKYLQIKQASFILPQYYTFHDDTLEKCSITSLLSLKQK